MDKVYISSNRVICCAQDDEYSDTYKAKFVICDFSTNENTVGINREKITNWMNTLVNKPLVGKLVSTAKGGFDFSGHNMKIVWKKDDNGNVYKDAVFDTSAFGTFTDVSIEKIDGIEYIVASCEIWKRFQNACALIMNRVESGTLSTSWEITVLDSHKENKSGKSVKIIDDGIFTAHCLLGEKVQPAYSCSRLIEIAEVNQDNQDFDDELATAFGRDIDSFDVNESKEDTSVQKAVTNSEPEISTFVATEPTEPEIDVADCGKKKEKSEDEKKDPNEDVNEDNSPSTEDDPKKDDESGACGACGDGEKKKENGECEGKKKETCESDESSETANENEQASLTVSDLTKKLCDAVRKMYECAWIEFHFPVEKTIWVKNYGHNSGSELDYKRFTYDVIDDEVVLSEPEDVTLTVAVSEVNAKFAEMTDSLITANSLIKEKDGEIATLNTYKEKFENAERERIEAEIAQKKSELRAYAIASGFINESEVSDGGEFASMIEANDEVGIKGIIADRLMASIKNSAKATEHEISAAKQKSENVKADLSNVDYGTDAKSIVRKYLGK